MTRSAGRTLFAHLQTWRPYTLWYPGLVGLAGAALAGRPPAVGLLLTAWGAPTLGWISGHYLGDWFDRELDAIAKPQRPIPQGRLSPRAAVVCGVGCALAAAVVTVLADWRAVLLVALAMAGVVAYSRVFKGRGLSGNVVRGVPTAITVVFGTMAVRSAPTWHTLLFALVFWAHDASSNLVGALRDVDGDREGGCRTMPVLRGVPSAVRTAAALYLGAIAVAFSGADLVPAAPWATYTLLLCAAGLGVTAFVPLLRNSAALTPRLALRGHEVLVAERLVLAGAVLAGGRGIAFGLAVLVPLLGVSVLTQARMRARHEFPDPAAPPPAVAAFETARPFGTARRKDGTTPC